MTNILEKLLEFNLIKYEDFENKEIEVNNYIGQINKKSTKKKVIVFLSYDETIDPFRTYLPYMKDFEFFLIFTNAVHNNWRNMHAEAIISIELNYKILINILEKSIYDLILIANINFFWHWRFVLIKEAVNNVPIVCYERDFTSRYHMRNKNVLEEFLENKILTHFYIECENFLFENADGILCSFDDNRLYELENKDKIVFYLPIKDPSENIFKPYVDSKIKLVHGGSLSLDSDKTLFNDWGKLQELFFNISKQASIDAYVPISSCYSNEFKDKSEWESYSHIKNFKINQFLPVEKFINYSSDNYIAGLCIINCSKIVDSSNIAYKYMYPTKIFTYLAAGLPVLISKDYKKSSEFILNNGLGLCLSNEEINSNSFKLNLKDLLEIKNNVGNFDFDGIFQNQLKKIEKLYNKLIKVKNE